MPARGERHGRAKLSLWDACAIRALLAESDPPSVTAIARAFGISRRHVRRVERRTHWAI